jgi:hypothetical protein
MRKGDMEGIALLGAVIAAIVILFIGIKFVQFGQDTGNKANPAGLQTREAVAYTQLKMKCGLWIDAIHSCSDYLCDSNCQNCIDTFSGDSLKIYSVMYYIRNAQLNNSNYFDPVKSVNTIACNRVLNDLTKSPNGEAASVVVDIAAAFKKDPTKLNEAAKACAPICVWVTDRDQNCRVDVQSCADQVIGYGQSVPINLVLP